jgi:hypothetical protein
MRLALPRSVVPALLVAIGLAAVPKVAFAQIGVGGSLGYVYDNQTDFIYLSAEARAALAGLPLDIQPRFTWQPVSGAAVYTYEINALYHIELRDTTGVRPYTGIGFVYQAISNGGSQAAGYNLIFGLEFPHLKKLRPFFQFEYSVLENHFPNQGTLGLGLLYEFK